MASLVIKIIIIQIVIRSIEDQASLVTMGKNLSENNFLTDSAQCCFKFIQNVSLAFLIQKAQLIKIQDIIALLKVKP